MSESWQTIVSGLTNQDLKLGATDYIAGFALMINGGPLNSEAINEVVLDAQHEFTHAAADEWGSGGYLGAYEGQIGNGARVTAMQYKPEGRRTGAQIAQIAAAVGFENMSLEDKQAYEWGIRNPQAIVDFDAGQILY